MGNKEYSCIDSTTKHSQIKFYSVLQLWLCSDVRYDLNHSHRVTPRQRRRYTRVTHRQDVRHALLNCKERQEVVRKLATLLNSFAPTELRLACIGERGEGGGEAL